jgi:hypothetical protein
MTWPEPTMGLHEGMLLSGMTYGELWLRQIAVGGTAAELEVEAYVLGLLSADSYQHNLIAQALNEHFIELGKNHPVGYREVATKE